MAGHSFDSVIPVVAVSNYTASRSWYVNLLGEPAIEPETGTGEWAIGSSWLQVTEDPQRAGHSIAILGTMDVESQVAACLAAGCSVSPIQDYGFIKLAELSDPDNNKLQIVQEIEGSQAFAPMMMFSSWR